MTRASNFVGGLGAVVSAFILSAAASAQVCTPQLRGFGTGPIDLGVNEQAYVSALLPFDEDGPGGQPESLVVAGRFVMTPAAQPTLPTAAVARYQGGVWSAMSAGLPNPGTSLAMRDLTVQDFSNVGGPGRSLYATGITDNGIVYRWTGTAWVSVGPAVGGVGYTLLATTDAQGPVLLAAGSSYSGGVIAWRGTGSWAPYAPLTPSGVIYRLRLVDDGNGPAVYAVGSFTDASRGISRMARLVNGQWTPVLPAPVSPQMITDITSFDSGLGRELYISGQFSTPTVSSAGIARLRGGVWEAVGGARVGTFANALGPTFFQLDEGAGVKLFAGGYIDDFNQRMGLVRLGDAGWEAPAFFGAPLGASSPNVGAVHAMARFDDGAGMRTYAGGSFAYVRGTYQPAQNSYGAVCDSLARTGTGGYESVAKGLGPTEANPSSQFFRYDLNTVNYGGSARMVATGGFGRAGGQSSFCAATFDGQGFTSLTPTGSVTVPQGMQRSAVFTLNGQECIVSSAPFGSLGLICAWDGTTWTRLTTQPGGGYCLALWVTSGRLFALTDAGLWRYETNFWSSVSNFTAPACAMIGDAGAGERLYFVTVQAQGPGIYQFDGVGVSLWATLNSTSISAMCLHDDGGGRTMYIVGPGANQGIQRREGNAWVTLAGGGLSMSTGVASMASFDDGRGPGLYVAGSIGLAGGQQTNGFARWRNNSWAPVTPYVAQQNSGGLSRTSMAVFNNRLYLAGEFTSIGGLNADHLAFIEACPFICNADFNHDGDFGTDQDIEAFFRCLSGDCCARCTVDFNGDGDFGTEQDIESFFRVLGGGNC